MTSLGRGGLASALRWPEHGVSRRTRSGLTGTGRGADIGRLPGLHPWDVGLSLGRKRHEARLQVGPDPRRPSRRDGRRAGRGVAESPVGQVAVGTGLTARPPRRSRRAAFPHRAPVEGRTRPGLGLGRPMPSRSVGSPLGDMPVPALGPGHASLLAFPSTGRLPSTISAADPGRRCSRLHRYYAAVRLLRPSERLRSSSFPTRPGIAMAVAGGRRSPRFRRVPFRRDVVFDPGGATAPRIAVPHMLPSTFPTASASATSGISGLNTHPAGSLCTLRSRRRRRPRNTRYRATRYRLTRAGLPPAGTRQLRLAHWNMTLYGEPGTTCW